MFNIQGYQPSIYQSKINGKSKGSGFVIYVREPFLFTVTEEYNECSPNLESFFITISNTEKPLTIGVVYRPPNVNKFDALSEFHTLIKKLPSSNVHINGDFNNDLHSNGATDFESIIYGSGYAPLVSIATHFKPGCNPSCIDNIFSNSTDSIIMSGVCEATIKHHAPIFCVASTSWKSCEPDIAAKKYDYNKSSMIKLENSFSSFLTSNNLFSEIFT